MLTFGDVVLPDLSVDYSAYLTEKNKCETVPLFNRNFTEENARLEVELKKMSLEFEEINTKEMETKKEVENLSAMCNQKLKELEIITKSITELQLLIKDIEDSKSKEELESLENAKKTLNTYKRLLKLKWLHSSRGNELESLIFNDKNAFLKYVKFDKNDPHIVEKVWTEISQASDNSWKNLLR